MFRMHESLLTHLEVAMPASLNLSRPKENGTDAYQMRRILLAHDSSYAAQQALEDAESFAHRFHAEIILVRVETAAEEFSSSAMASQRKEDASELNTLAKCLTAKGIANRAVLRTGTVGDTLFHIAHQEKADLLMLGAYGRGSQDRQALGSTAEHLLRSIPCPVLTYGPHATAGLMHRMTAVPSLLVAIPLPFSFAWLEPALQFAHLFDLAIELVHVTESPAAHTDNAGYREQCDTLVQQIRQKGIAAGWTIFVGVPAIFLHACAVERESPLIVLPLQRRDRLSSITSDNVAAQIIRCSIVPVLSYRID